MNIFFYIIIFVIGTLFGSFFTLAVYRIPKKIDIISKHSFCPKCGHKLGFLELIPVFSYLFLGGKCKNCGDKMNNNLRKKDNDKESLYLLYLCIVEDIGIKRFNEIQEKYFNNKFLIFLICISTNMNKC